MSIKRVLKYFFLVLAGMLLVFVLYIFIWFPGREKSVKWGMTFSQKYSQLLGLDWRQNYLALLDDLKIKNFRLIAYWDLIAPEKGEYDFSDLDWQISEAQARGARIILVTGIKTPRWPECHIPAWANGLAREEQQKNILAYLEETVLRYKDNSAVWAWQVENEPFFSFGVCPWTDVNFLEKEVSLVKELDSSRPIIITDSGEMSFWFNPARAGDIVGTTMYRGVWSEDLKMYLKYPLPAMFYQGKAEIIKKIFNKEVINVELQAEPWGPDHTYNMSLEEQLKSMNLTQFKKNVKFAQKTNLPEAYFWGGEWWYWLKEKKNMPEIWNEARALFTSLGK